MRGVDVSEIDVPLDSFEVCTKRVKTVPIGQLLRLVPAGSQSDSNGFSKSSPIMVELHGAFGKQGATLLGDHQRPDPPVDCASAECQLLIHVQPFDKT